MQPTDFDRKLIETLREVVRGNEDYVYRTPEVVPDYFQYSEKHPEEPLCFYEDGLGKPSCVFGHVAHRLDLLIEEGKSVTLLAEVWGASPPVIRALQLCQSIQDEGSPWGVALASAEQLLEIEGVVI